MGSQKRVLQLLSPSGHPRLFPVSVQWALIPVHCVAIRVEPVGVLGLQNSTTTGEVLDGEVGVPCAVVYRRQSICTFSARPGGYRRGLTRGGQYLGQTDWRAGAGETPKEVSVGRVEADRELGYPHRHRGDADVRHGSRVGAGTEARKKDHRVCTTEKAIAAAGDAAKLF